MRGHGVDDGVGHPLREGKSVTLSTPDHELAHFVIKEPREMVQYLFGVSPDKAAGHVLSYLSDGLCAIPKRWTRRSPLSTIEQGKHHFSGLGRTFGSAFKTASAVREPSNA